MARDAGYYQAKLAAAQYWIKSELPCIRDASFRLGLAAACYQIRTR